MIESYVITLRGDEYSDRATRRLEESAPSNVSLNRFDAVTPDQVDRLMKKLKLKWTYPWQGQEFNFAAGLVLTAYPTAEPKKRIGCFLSHYMLWERCIKRDEPIIIHEQDSIYYSDEAIPYEDWMKSKYDIIGLNSPFSATRLASAYDRITQESKADPYGIVRAPLIDDHNVPQGIAGNSSYYIEPTGAHRAISLVKEHGCWPNDAIMNRQLISTLGQTKHYYTYVQGLRSTTTL